MMPKANAFCSLTISLRISISIWDILNSKRLERSVNNILISLLFHGEINSMILRIV